MNGLHEMIKIRGGLNTTNSCHGLRRLAAWYALVALDQTILFADFFHRADLQSANTLATVPILPSLDVLLKETFLEDDPLDSPEIRSLYGFFAMSGQETEQYASCVQVLNERVIIQLGRLRRLSSYLSSNQKLVLC
jgi:hypothetical protein